MKKIEIYNCGEFETYFYLPEGQEDHAKNVIDKMMKFANSKGCRYQYEIKE